jgi:hypothetical protein
MKGMLEPNRNVIFSEVDTVKRGDGDPGDPRPDVPDVTRIVLISERVDHPSFGLKPRSLPPPATPFRGIDLGSFYSRCSPVLAIPGEFRPD